MPEKYEKSIFWQDKREGTKRSCPFCSGQLGPGLNGQECLFIIILSTLTVHQVRGGDRGTRLNSQSGMSWWGLDFGCVPSGCLSWGLTWHVGSQNYTLTIPASLTSRPSRFVVYSLRSLVNSVNKIKTLSTFTNQYDTEGVLILGLDFFVPIWILWI